LPRLGQLTIIPLAPRKAPGLYRLVRRLYHAKRRK
jgi:hypothetical protein